MYKIAKTPPVADQKVKIGSPYVVNNSSVSYQKVPISKQTYLAYVVVIRDSLNFHLDIYWPEKVGKKYENVINYDYDFRSEELGSEIITRKAYSCHLKGVEIANSDKDFYNAKEAHSFITKKIARTNGWVLVSLSDIDIYRRILVTLFDVITRTNINDELLLKKSPRTGTPIAKEYVRPARNKSQFTPSVERKDYRIIWNGAKN